MSTTPLRAVRTNGQNHLAAAQAALVPAALVLAVMVYSKLTGVKVFPTPEAQWLALTAAAAVGYFGGLVAAVNGDRLTLIDPAKPAARTVAVTGWLLAAVVALFVWLTPGRPTANPREADRKDQAVIAQLEQRIQSKSESEERLKRELKATQDQNQALRLAGKQPDPESLKREQDLKSKLDAATQEVKSLKETKKVAEEQVAERSKAPTEEAELPKPPTAPDPVPKPNTTNPDGRLPEPPAPKGDDPASMIRAVGALILAFVFPELAPIFAALGLDMALGGTQIRDLPAMKNRAEEIYKAGKDVDVPAMVRKIAGERFGNPSAAIASLQKIINDPVIRKKIGEDKAAEFEKQLDDLKLIWSRLDRVAHALGADHTMDLVRDLPPKLGDAAQLTEYAKTLPPGVDCTRAIWFAALDEFIRQAEAGRGLRLGADGRLVPFSLSAAEAGTARAALEKAKKEGASSGTPG
jgi:hypothetical protein